MVASEEIHGLQVDKIRLYWLKDSFWDILREYNTEVSTVVFLPTSDSVDSGFMLGMGKM